MNNKKTEDRKNEKGHRTPARSGKNKKENPDVNEEEDKWLDEVWEELGKIEEKE